MVYAVWDVEPNEKLTVQKSGFVYTVDFDCAAILSKSMEQKLAEQKFPIGYCVL